MLRQKVSLSNITPRRLIFGISVIVILYITSWFLFSYSLLTISVNTNESAQVRVGHPGEAKDRSFELKGKSKTILLKRSVYKVSAIKADQFSSYKKSLGFLWFNKIHIKFEPQKSSKFLGISQLPCAMEKGQEILFSSCSPYDTGNVLVSSARGPLTQKNPVESDHDSATAGVLKSYKDGYLNAKVTENKLIISARETSNNESLIINEFKGELNGDRFSASPELESFAVYNTSSSEVLSFKNISDNNPLKISLPKDINKTGFVNKVFISNKYVYLLNAQDYKIEDHSHINGEEKEPEKPEDPSKILSRKYLYTARKGNLETEQELPGEWQIQNAAAGSNNQVLISVSLLKRVFTETFTSLTIFPNPYL